MKRIQLIIRRIVTGVMLIIATGCATTKNTWLSRNYHALTTRYNVFFNGNESYKEGVANMYLSEEDYTGIIPIYPISVTGMAANATSQMDRTLEKTQKAEKLHSIRKKPNKNPNKAKDPKYQLFMKKEEYNTQMGRVWILQGKAQFQKTDFLAAVGTFSYVIKHFEQEPKRVVEAKIWLAKSYAEMGWFYDAEDVLNKLEKESNIPANLVGDFAGARADLLIKQKNYSDAIDPLTISAREERMKMQRARSYYVLAQLCRKENQNQKAIGYYKKVARINPNFYMTFHAKMNQAEADDMNYKKSVRKLEKMAKKDLYKDDLDKIYYTIGKIYQNQEDLPNAKSNYKLAVENSVKNGSNKIEALLALADLYYAESNYLEAQPYYVEAASLLPATHVNYEYVSKRSQVLNELNTQNAIVTLQDSLLRLASMGEEERNQSIRNTIKRMKEEEELAQKRFLEQEEKAMLREMESATASANPFDKNTNWYFYNPSLINSGKVDFKNKWGSRKLEDHWRRRVKTVDMYGNDEENEEDDSPLEMEDIVENTSKQQMPKIDAKDADIEEYIKQLPFTDTQKKASEGQIATALYNMGMIYQEKLEDIPMAIKTFEELERRFPRDKRLPDMYFMLYQMSMKNSDTSKAEWYRKQLIQKFPESSYAQVLSQPNYLENIKRMTAMQDSIYQQAYLAYTQNNFNEVSTHYNEIKETYPLSPLMPKFMFINALAKGKQGKSEVLKSELETLVTEYPESDVSAMSKSILAIMQQGREVQAGSSHGSILEKRDSISSSADEIPTDSLYFTVEKRDLHKIALLISQDVNINKLLFDVAAYNFTGFLVRDFDLEIQRYDKQNVLTISTLDDMSEAFWYLANIEQDSTIGRHLNPDSCRAMIISESNLETVKKGLSFSDYETFYADSILPLREMEVIDPRQVEEQRESFIAATIAAENMSIEMEQKAQEAKLAEELRLAEELQNPQKSHSDVVPSTAEKTASTADKKQEGKSTVIDKKATEKSTTIVDKKESTAQELVAPKHEVVTAENRSGVYAESFLEQHAFMILVTGNGGDLDQVKTLFDKYNASHYPLAQLKIRIINYGEKQILSVEKFATANAAKNYMFGVIRERNLFAPLQKVTFRNTIISSTNQSELEKTADFDGYIEFNRKTYLR